MKAARASHFPLACALLLLAQAAAGAYGSGAGGAAAGAGSGAQGPGRLFTLDEAMGAISAAAGSPGAFRWDPFFQEGSFAAGGRHAAFSAAQAPGQAGFLMVNGRDLHAVPLPHVEAGELAFPEAFVAAARGAFARAEERFHYRIAAIVIDAGHGGRDPGAVFEHEIGGSRRLVRESDIALDASAMLRDMLVRRFPGKRVLMTRERDITMSLEERTDLANSVPTRDDEGIIFVSIHANAAMNRSARGFEVWHITHEYQRRLDIVDEAQFPDPYLRRMMNTITGDAFNAESVMLAQSILNGLHSAVGSEMPNRGLRAENWFVVRRSNMPAVLVELGFVTNRQDALLMTSEAYLRRMVEGVYSGIADFVDAFERSGGFVIAQ